MEIPNSTHSTKSWSTKMRKMPFRYQRSLSNKQIRLLHIRSSLDPQEKIHCSFVYCELDSDYCPNYTALSYCWGDPSDRKQVLCNNRLVEITASLEGALRRFRDEDQACNLIWADALCINQDDIQEKNHQIPLMREIYSRANTTVVWLGEATFHDAKKMVDLSRIVDREYSPDDADATFQWFSEALENDGDWLSIEDFYGRPYFTRIWCFQEVILSRKRNLLFYYGDQTIHWKSVASITKAIDKEVSIRGYPSSCSSFPVIHSRSLPMTTDEGLDPLGSSLRYLLWISKPLDATDPRDKIYGIVGLANPHSVADLVVDYGKSVANVYADAVIACWRDSFDTRILLQVKHPVDYNGNDGFASWVPRWDLDASGSAISTLNSLPILYSETVDWHPYKSPLLSIVDEKPFINGAVIDCVSSVTAILATELIDGFCRDTRLTKEAVMELWSFVARKARGQSCAAVRANAEALTRTLAPDYFWGDIREPHPFHAIYFMEHLFQDVSHPLKGSFQDYAIELNAAEQSGRNYEATADRMYDEYVRHCDRPTLGGTVVGESKRESHVSETFRHPEFDLFRGLQLDENHQIDNFELSLFISAAEVAFRNRRMFWTKNSMYGLGPGCMREGDIIVVFHVHQDEQFLFPVALRPVSDHATPGHDSGYLYLGEVYIDDLQSGKMRGRMECGEFEERTFQLI